MWIVYFLVFILATFLIICICIERNNAFKERVFGDCELCNNTRKIRTPPKLCVDSDGFPYWGSEEVKCPKCWGKLGYSKQL